MRAKWKARRGFVKMHVLVDTETMKILALEVTNDSVGDSSMFSQLLGQVVGAERPKASGNNSSITEYENLLASGVPPLASICSGASGVRAAPDLLFGDAAYGSKQNMAACARAGVTLGIMHKINATARGKGSSDAWGASVRDQLGASPDATRLDLMDREEKRENQAYWKARIGYGHRWIVESVFSAFKRLFGEHLMVLSGTTSCRR